MAGLIQLKNNNKTQNNMVDVNSAKVINDLSSNNDNGSSASQPIWIPNQKSLLKSDQLRNEGGSIDSGCLGSGVGTESQDLELHLKSTVKNNVSTLTTSIQCNGHLNPQKKSIMEHFKTRSVSLGGQSVQSIIVPPKSPLRHLKMNGVCRRQLLSQDSGIDGEITETDSTSGSQTRLKTTAFADIMKGHHTNLISTDTFGRHNSSGDLIPMAERERQKNIDDMEDASYSYTSSVGSYYSYAGSREGGLGSVSGGITRRTPYKPCNSTGTLGLTLGGRIEEVDDHDDLTIEKLSCDDQDHNGEVVVCVKTNESEEDDGEDSGLQMIVDSRITSALDSKTSSRTSQQSREMKEEQLEDQQQGIDSAMFSAKTMPPFNKDCAWGTDGYYHFPLLDIGSDLSINPKLINKKDGLKDTMYYLDEFGSPKLREKYANKPNKNRTFIKKVKKIDLVEKDSITSEHCDTEEGLNANEKGVADGVGGVYASSTTTTTTTCASWTKVFHKFKNIIGKAI